MTGTSAPTSMTGMTHPDAPGDASGVWIRELTDLADLRAACALFTEIWRPAPDNPPVTAELMRALASGGGYVAGAFDGARLVAASAGFCGPPRERCLHSHIAGVAASARGRGVGRALKLHQRAWALERGIDQISWTFDPLVRRNAWFNLTRLGARPVAYLPDFYGGMHDAINGDDQSDRLLVRWDLTLSPVDSTDAVGADVALAAGLDGTPSATETSAATVLVGVPDSIESLRRERPDVARSWRLALRRALGDSMSAGAKVIGFDKDGGYVVRTRQDGEQP